MENKLAVIVFWLIAVAVITVVVLYVVHVINPVADEQRRGKEDITIL